MQCNTLSNDARRPYSNNNNNNRTGLLIVSLSPSSSIKHASPAPGSRKRTTRRRNRAIKRIPGTRVPPFINQPSAVNLPATGAPSSCNGVLESGGWRGLGGHLGVGLPEARRVHRSATATCCTDIIRSSSTSRRSCTG